MKKLLLSLLGMAMFLGLAGGVYAATTADIYIHVFVVSGSVSIVRDTTVGDVYFAPAISALSSTRTASAIPFRNDGDTPSNWRIQDTFAFPGWTFATDAPGTVIATDNVVRLSALFAAQGTQPALTDFLVDDVVSTTLVPCSATEYAITADAVALKGVNVLAGQSRYLWLRFDAPTAASANLNVDQVTTVVVSTVTAI